MARKACGNGHEETFGKALGEALSAAMPSAAAQTGGSGKHAGRRPDIVIIDARMSPSVVESACGGKVKPGGRIGLALPFVAAFEESWAATRRMLERDFTDIAVVSFFDSAGMPELMLVATRRAEPASKHAMINCVKLYAPVAGPEEAGELATAISRAIDGVEGAWSHRPVMLGDAEVGQVCVFDAGGKGALWAPLGVIHVELGRAADNLTRGRLEFEDASMALEMGMTTLKDLFRVGPAHSQIGHERGKRSKGAFELIEISESADGAGADRALWSADGKAQDGLVVAPTHKGVPVPGRSAACKQMRARSSRLFYARGRGLQWTAQESLAAMTKAAAMGGRAWTGLENDDIRICKAFALWANSTFGMLIHWTQGQKTQVGRSAAQIRALGRIPCPRLDRLGDGELDLAAAAFDALAAKKLLPACRAHEDKTRGKIDAAVVTMLGLPETAHEVVAEIRLHWCREPSIQIA